MTVLLSAARGEQPNQLRNHFGLGRVVDERPVPAALHETCTTQKIEMVRERRPGNLELCLDLSDRDFLSPSNQKKEDLEPGRVS
jgi:hypothetical protein